MSSWEELVRHHTTHIETLPLLRDSTYLGEPYSVRPEALLRYPGHTQPCPFRLETVRNPVTGEVMYRKEVSGEVTGVSRSVRSYTSRLPTAEGGVKGATTGCYYWAGGFSSDEEEEEEEDVPELDMDNLLTTAPGLEKGADFGSETVQGLDSEPTDIQELIAKLDEVAKEEEGKKKQRRISTKLEQQEEDEEDEGRDGGRYKWAITLDTEGDVPEFDTQIVNLAYQFKFTLDPFQKQAILKLHTHDNVMVAAHTSAGKTVVAEYAIALSKHHMTKVIYTSPIKALSNQKYRDFKEKFGDVGLLTGDIQISTTAQCLIMTTEILRSMLYNGSDITRDLEWVIFDEVHYINNEDRGVVWEEVLIMLPEHVSVILLSATVANVTDFAEWVGNTKQKEVYVVKTLKRPVPLEHYLYTGSNKKTSKDLFRIVAAGEKKFDAEEHKRAKASIEGRKGKGGGRPNPTTDRNTIISLVRMLEQENLLPAVVFMFSKKRIRELVEGLNSLDLTVAKEKNVIRDFTGKCVARLKGTDQSLPQIQFLRELMERGIAVHHSGILPLMKETTELLFEKGLIKILFATETFAMGINMPTRTVVFDKISKWDGADRPLQTSEYIQMAGRAGRRGKDETGTVIILCKGRVPDAIELQSMVLGKATDLSSRFRPTYNMILSVMKGKDLRVEDMLKRSFAEYEGQVSSRDYKKERKSLEKKLAGLQTVECAVCGDLPTMYSEALVMLEEEATWRDGVMTSQRVGKFLHPGRCIIVSTAQFPFHAAAVVGQPREGEDSFSVVVVHEHGYDSGVSDTVTEEWEKEVNRILCSPGVMQRTIGNLQLPVSDPAFSPCTVTPSQIAHVLHDKVTQDMDAIRKDLMKLKYSPGSWNSTLLDTLAREVVQKRKLSEVHYEIKQMERVEQQMRMERQRECMSRFSTSCLHFTDHLRQTGEREFAQSELRWLSYQLSDQSLHFMPEFEARVRVLRRLGYLRDNDQLKLKGKAACAMSTSELVITELVFDNFFNKNLEVEAIVAILSCMVFQQKTSKAEPEWTEELLSGKERFLKLAHKIVEAEVAEGLIANDADYDQQFKFGAVEVVYRWARGEQFSQIMECTDVDEGTIVRCITRLDEVLRCIKDVARIVGDVDFGAKMDRASQSIKRDIVFAASLYVQ